MADEPSGRDPFLTALVKGADRIKAEDRTGGSDITIIVGGAIISGRLTGEAQYFSMIAEGFEQGSAGHPELAQAPAYFVQRSRLAERDAAEDDYEPSFLHLREVQVVGGPGLIKTHDFMIRIRFSEVQGFALSTFSTTKKHSGHSVTPPATKKRHR